MSIPVPHPAAAALTALLVLVASPARAVRLDTYDEREDRGITARSVQKQVDVAVIAGTLGLALVEGTSSKAGQTAWQATDAMLATAATTETMKRVFQRARPSESSSSDRWFSGSSNRSFPSGETAMMAAAVTPWILQWQDEQPAVWAAAALPVWMGYSRMAAQGHWLSDVLVGGAIGVAWGRAAAAAPSPWTLGWTVRQAYVGWRYRW